jgi:hypothetical protein
MVLNRSAQLLLNLKKTTKNNPLKSIQVHKKHGMLNIIKQLQHLMLCNMIYSITHDIALNEVQ